MQQIADRLEPSSGSEFRGPEPVDVPAKRLRVVGFRNVERFEFLAEPFELFLFDPVAFVHLD